MTKQVIAVGSSPDDGTGDTLRNAGIKINANFTELYDAGWTILVLAADFTTGSATAVDVTGLAFTPLADTRYEFEAKLMTRTATATVGPRPGLAWPTGANDGAASIWVTSAAGTQVMQNGNPSASVLAPVGGLPTTTGSWPAFIEGQIIMGSSPSGNLRVQLASETAATNVTIRAGSFIKYRVY